MKILRTITFLFREKKINVLKNTISAQLGWVEHDVETVVVSDVPHEIDGRNFLLEVDPLGIHNVKWCAFENLADPWLLTWQHKPIHSLYYDAGYDFFIHTEDDIVLHKYNIDFWLEHRSELKVINCYPIVLRVEKRLDGWYFTDVLSKLSERDCVYKSKNLEYRYYSLTNPYQAAFLYDRDLMLEHISDNSFELSRSFDVNRINANPGHPGGGVAEAAVNGLTYVNPTPPMQSRALLPIIHYFGVLDNRCITHHFGDCYVESTAGFCSIRLDEIYAEVY